jgi:outer membrane protein assembly factor BamB
MSSNLQRRLGVWCVTGLALIGSVAISGSAMANAPEDWSQWRGPKRDGVSSETKWAENIAKGGPKQLWTAELGLGFSSVSVFKDRVYSMGWRDGQDSVYALDEATGKVIWTHSYASPKWDNMHEGGPASTPAVDEQIVATVSREAQLVVLDTATGKPRYVKDLKKEFGVAPPQWGFCNSPLLLNDQIIVDVGVIAAFEKSTGKLLWKSKNYGPAYSSVVPFVLDGKPALAAFPKSGLVVLNQSDGSEVTTYPWDTSYGVHASTPVVIGSRVFISSGYNKGGVLVDVAGGKAKLVWQTREMRSQMASCVVFNGSLFGFDEGRLICVDLETGNARWNERGLGKGALMLAGGKLVIASEKGDLIIAEASNEKYVPLARVPAAVGQNWTAPVLANGKVYCRNSKGLLVCLTFEK